MVKMFTPKIIDYPGIPGEQKRPPANPELELTLADFFAVSEKGAFITDQEGTLKYSNNAMHRILGYSENAADKVIGLNFKDFMSPENAKNIITAFISLQDVKTKENVFDVEIKTNSGEKKTLEVSACLFRNPLSGENLGFGGIVLDITEKEQNEPPWELAGVAAYQITIDGTLVKVNSNFLKMLNLDEVYTVESIRGKNINEVWEKSEPDGSLRELVKKEKTVTQRTENIRTLGTGKEKWVEKTASYNEKNGLISVVMFDVTNLRNEADYDYLTELPLRRRVEVNLDILVKNAYRKQSNLAVLYIDLNEFGLVNDTLGHQAGDELLKKAASVLKELRHVDICGRFGGDEFVVLLQEDKRIDFEARLVAGKIKDSLEGISIGELLTDELRLSTKKYFQGLSREGLEGIIMQLDKRMDKKVIKELSQDALCSIWEKYYNQLLTESLSVCIGIVCYKPGEDRKAEENKRSIDYIQLEKLLLRSADGALYRSKYKAESRKTNTIIKPSEISIEEPVV